MIAQISVFLPRSTSKSSFLCDSLSTSSFGLLVKCHANAGGWLSLGGDHTTTYMHAAVHFVAGHGVLLLRSTIDIDHKTHRDPLISTVHLEESLVSTQVFTPVVDRVADTGLVAGRNHQRKTLVGAI